MEEHIDRKDAHVFTTLDVRPDVERSGEPFVRITCCRYPLERRLREEPE